MFPSAGALSVVAARSIDPTDHGSNLGAVAGLAVAILVFIGLLVFLITRWGRAAPDPRAGPGPESVPESESVPEPEPAPESAPERVVGRGPASGPEDPR
jgi:hypothetical protein